MNVKHLSKKVTDNGLFVNILILQGYVMYDREPVGSNIYDAINYMKKKIEEYEAIMNETPIYNRIARLPTFAMHILTNFFFIYLGAYIIFGLSIILSFGLIIGVLGFFSWGGFFVSLILCIALIVFGAKFMDDAQPCLESKKNIAKLSPILSDLQRLYEYDPTMNVGFQLDNKGEIDFTTLTAMMRKREREIKQKARP
jgi:hypothetical protein